MSNPEHVILLGCDHGTPGQIFTQSVGVGKVAFGMSVGQKPKPNQDALAVIISENSMLLSIADGHWGDEASNLAVRKSIEVFQSTARPPNGNEVRGRLYALIEQINRDLFNLALQFPGAPTPETSLIVCYLLGGADAIRLYWVSFGDSYLFLQSGSVTRQINTLYPRWLGALSKMSEFAGDQGISIPYPAAEPDRYLGVAAGLESGMETIASGSSLLLCSDGLIEPAGPEYKITPTELHSVLVSHDTPEVQVRTLMSRTLERGGGDNISCILTQFL